MKWAIVGRKLGVKLKKKFWWGIVAFFFSMLSSAVHANEIKDIRVNTSKSETRTVIDLSASAEYSYFTLATPHRLVVDLKNTKNSAKLPKSVTKSPILTKIRESSPPDGSSFRLVFELKSNVSPKLFKLTQVVVPAIVSLLTFRSQVLHQPVRLRLHQVNL
ncbi:N-acetylmuramoyl-L-alanine amidase [Vibrio sp. JCM 19236]|nr:N-acetylmuramoyl-L-alanine amidase [Vibrio sp. JCM 19236]